MLLDDGLAMNYSEARKTQSGFTLVEVLVSIAIGLVILTAIAVVFQTTNNIQRQRDDLAEVTEPIKLVTNLLKDNITQAGYVDVLDIVSIGNTNSRASSIFVPGSAVLQNMFVRNPMLTISTPISQFFPGLTPVFGCAGAMASSPNVLASTTPPVAPACGTANALRNSVQFAFQITRTPSGTSLTSSLPDDNPSTGEGRDCLQQRIYNPTTPTNLAGAAGIVINRFFVQANPGDGVNELYCAGSGNATAQPVARGVEEFVVRYQLAQAGTAAIAAVGGGKSQFLTATQVAADTVGWPGVSAVEICMVTATAQSSVVNNRAAALGTVSLQAKRPTCERDTSGAYKADVSRASGDSRLWERSTFTYSVRNAIFATSI